VRHAAGRPRVAVAGGSIAGLTAAIHLADAGCEVEVFERAEAPLEGQGAGIVLNPATVRCLVERGAVDLQDISVTTRYLRYLGAAGELASETPAPYRFTSYNALYDALLRCFGRERYRFGATVASFAQTDAAVTLELEDGTDAAADALVCADGIRSASRAHLVPEAEPRYAGYVAWRGTAALEDLDADCRRAFADAITYCVLPHGHLLAYPIPAPEAEGSSGRRLLNWLWYVNVPAGAELDDLLTDVDGVRRAVSVPPGLVAPRHVERLRDEAARTLPPQLATTVRATLQPFVQVVFDVEVPRMAFGRVCLIGDAAFACRPHAAAGSAKAAEDAYRIGQALRAADGDVVEALRRWEPDQLRLGRTVLARTREAGSRSQFEGTWRVGDPLPFGLYEIGDSLAWAGEVTGLASS
jgi:2,6-dihydroxypyridine 3-monooxygenase